MSESMLDLLRQRTAANMQNERIARLSEFGAGMAASGSPNFFTMLSAGARAQREGDATRMEELRRIAEAERQAAEQQSQEQYRRDQLEIERQRRANEERRINAEIERGNRPTFSFMRNADGTGVVAVDPRDPSRIIPVPGAVLATDRTAREETALRQNARNQAQMAANQEATRRSQLGQTMSSEDIATFRRTTEEQLLASIGLLPLAGAGAAPAPQDRRPVIRDTYVPPNERR
jgi:hypothetical protein